MSSRSPTYFPSPAPAPTSRSRSPRVSRSAPFLVERTYLNALILEAILTGTGNSLIADLTPFFQIANHPLKVTSGPAGNGGASRGGYISALPESSEKAVPDEVSTEWPDVAYAVPPAPPIPSIFQSVTSSPAAGPVTSVTDNASIVQVFYATDRASTSAPNAPPAFAAGRSTNGALNYGTCDISIPKIHKLGKIESPSWLRAEFRPDPAKHIIMTSIESEDEDQFFAHVANRVARTITAEAFVFVHGFNVLFEDAARRTGQIAFDLFFAGAPIFYSWPSNGKVGDYTFDETNVAWSAPHLQQFLLKLHQFSGAERIHVIAHSMGNRAVCEALKNISFDPASGLHLHNLILAAPDIDADTFGELAANLRKVSERITLYQSSKDKAIAISKRIHGNLRAGEPLLVIPGVDTIDASSIDTDFLGHSYFSDKWSLLSDIHALIANDTAPPRFGLESLKNTLGPYYSFRA